MAILEINTGNDQLTDTFQISRNMFVGSIELPHYGTLLA